MATPAKLIRATPAALRAQGHPLLAFLCVWFCLGALLAAQQPDIVLDSEQTAGIAPHAITISGTWATAGLSAAGRHGASQLSDGSLHSTTNKVKYTPSIPSAGYYAVSVWSDAGAGYATNVPVEIRCAAGTVVRTLNQTVNGGRWVALGTYRFNAGTAGSVTILSQSSTVVPNGEVIADAVRFTKVGQEIVQDSQDPAGVTLTGSWAAVASGGAVNAAAAALNGNYLHDAGTGQLGAASCVAEYRPAIPVAGDYEVYATWVADPANSPNAHYSVYSASAASPTRLSVDQRQNGYEWVYLGTYNFAQGSNANGRVVLENGYAQGESGGRVVADAVRFVRVTGAEFVINASSSSNPAGTAAATGTWTTASTANDKLDADYRTAPASGSYSYLFTPNLPQAGYHSVYLWWPQSAAFTSRLTVEVTAAPAPGLASTLNTLTVPSPAQQAGGGTWNYLGEWWFNAGTTGTVRIKNTLATGTVVADAVAFVRGPDADRDGMRDAWESANGLNPSSDTDRDLDADGDGRSNLQEFLAGSDPQDFYNGVVSSVRIVSGNSQFGEPGTFAPQPLVLEVRQSAGGALMFNAPVRFSITSTTGGALAASLGGPSQATALTVRTDAVTGQAAVYFQEAGSYGLNSVVRALAGKAASTGNYKDFTVSTHRFSGFWRFDEAAADPAVLDSAPVAAPNHGTLAGPGVVRAAGFLFNPTATDRCLSLDGTGGAVSVPSSSALQFSSTPLFTAAAWIKLDPATALGAATNLYPILSKWAATGTGFEFAIKGGTAKGLSFRSLSAGATAQEVLPAADQRALLLDGKPHLVAFTRDAAKVGRLYIDGIEVGSGSVTGSFASAAPLLLGANAAPAAACFKGSLDDVRLYASPLRPDELFALLDGDRDGMADWWERKYLPGGVAASPAGDADLDGLGNLLEYQLKCDPLGIDSDGDGMSDGWENQFGLSPSQWNDPSADPDQDGLGNLAEYQQGRNPNKAGVSPVSAASLGLQIYVP